MFKRAASKVDSHFHFLTVEIALANCQQALLLQYIAPAVYGWMEAIWIVCARYPCCQPHSFSFTFSLEPPSQPAIFKPRPFVTNELMLSAASLLGAEKEQTFARPRAKAFATRSVARPRVSTNHHFALRVQLSLAS